MANPYHHAAMGTAKAKFKAIHRAGGGKAGHSDAAQDKKLFKSLMREHDHKAVGRKAGGRLDRKHHRKTKITIEKVAPAGASDPAAMGAPVAPPPTAMPPPGMSSGPMPQMGPGGMQKRGGRVKRAKGGRVHKDEGGSVGKRMYSQQEEMAAPPSNRWNDMMNTPYKNKGGRVYIEGESSKANIKDWSNRAKKNSYARGGGIGKYPLTAGADSGEGRLQQAHAAKRKG